MATQQPLSGRGLSRTVLQAPDILGERMQLEQLGLRRDALDASQRAKVPQPKLGEAKDFKLQGRYFTPAQQKAIDIYKKFMDENGVAANADNYGTPYFDEQLYGKRKNLEKSIEDFLYLTGDVTKTVNKDAEDLDEREKSVAGFLDFAEGAAGMAQSLDVDEQGNLVYGDDKQSVFSSEYISQPQSFYYKPVNWSKEALDEIVKPYVDVETGAITTKNLDLGKVRNQAKGILNLSDNKANFQKSFAASYLQENYGLDPRQMSSAVNELITEGELTVGDEVISIEDVKGWAEDYIVDQVRNQSSYTKREDEDGGGIEFNFGNWSSKSGVRPIDAKKIYYGEGVEFPVGAVSLPTDTYKVPVDRSVFPESDTGEIASAYVDVLYTDGNDIYANVRGLKKDGTFLNARGVKLDKAQVGNLEGDMKLPQSANMKDVLTEAGAIVGNMQGAEEESVDSEQEETFTIEGQSYTKQQLLDGGWTEQQIEQLKNR